jgi:arylsulfatase A-like enzyme
MPRRNILSILMVLFFMLPGCSLKEEKTADFTRFIDVLSLENIHRSPFLECDIPSSTWLEKYPEGSFPLTEKGIGDNPWGIKRKLKTGGVERNVFFAPPESEYRFPIKNTTSGIFEFGIGIVGKGKSKDPEGDSRDQKGVNFIVRLGNEDSIKTVFQKFISLSPEEGQGFIFSRHSIELPPLGSGTFLSLETQGALDNHSFWFNPVLRLERSEGCNVILISIDTLRADHLGCYGYEKDTSPNIDELASDSAVFLNVYSASPWTLPSHVSIMTGLYGVHHQVYHDSERMDPKDVTLAEKLRENFYKTTAFTGGGFVSSVYGFSKGFDSYYEGEGGIFHQDSAERVFSVVSQWIDRSKGQDFFLFVHTYQPHSPYACPPPYKFMFLDDDAKWGHIDLIQHLGGNDCLYKELPDEERRNIIALYDGEIRYTDEMLIAPLIDKLKETGLYERTLLILTSDHGEEFFDHSAWGHGYSVYDEALKVPLLIKFPDSHFKGKRITKIVSLVDIMPTILNWLEVDFSDIKIDGTSLLPVVTDRENTDRKFLADVAENVLNYHNLEKITTNQDKLKLILNKSSGAQDDGFFRFLPPDIPAIEIYDLIKDSEEKNNVAEKYPDLTRQIISWIDDFYSQAVKKDVKKMVMDEKLKEQLRALGYIK